MSNWSQYQLDKKKPDTQRNRNWDKPSHLNNPENEGWQQCLISLGSIAWLQWSNENCFYKLVICCASCYVWLKNLVRVRDLGVHFNHFRGNSTNSILLIKEISVFQFSWIGSRIREFQKAQVGSNERKCCRDGLETSISVDQLSAKYSRWVLLVLYKAKLISLT